MTSFLRLTMRNQWPRRGKSSSSALRSSKATLHLQDSWRLKYFTSFPWGGTESEELRQISRNTPEQNGFKTCEINSHRKVHLQNHVSLLLAHEDPWHHDKASLHHCWQRLQQLIYNIFCPFGCLHVLRMFVWTHGGQRSLQRLPTATGRLSCSNVQTYKTSCSLLKLSYSTNNKVSSHKWSTKSFHFSIFEVILLYA